MSSFMKRKSSEPDDKNKKSCLSIDMDNTSKETEDWRLTAVNLRERLIFAVKEDHLTDISFCVGSEKKIFHAHKVILSLASPVFEAMLHGSLKETQETIVVPDIKPDGFQFLLDFVYTDDVKFENEENALSAWIAADKYCLPHMKAKCIQFLSECTITSCNVWYLLEHYLFIDTLLLADRCLGFLEKNMSDALNSQSFLSINPDTLKNILLRPSMCVNEVTLLRSIVKWGQERTKCEPEKSLLEHVQPFLGYIRFSKLSQKEFVNFINDYPDVISDSDSLALIKYMTDPLKFSLPQWCSSDVNSRLSQAERQKLNPTNQNRINIFSYALKPRTYTREMENDSILNAPAEEYEHPDNEVYQANNIRLDFVYNLDNSTDSDSSDLSSSDSDFDYVKSNGAVVDVSSTSDTSSSD